MSTVKETGMPSTLAEWADALEVERLAPVPRASHVLAVDAGDVALVLEHLAALRRRGQPPVNDDVTIACQRLRAAIRCHAAAR
jgi:hypothetical protein